MNRLRLAAAGVGLAAIVFAVEGGEYSTLDYLELRRQERAESLRVVTLERMVDSLAAVATAVETDPLVQERIARERYSMIREGEFVYRIIGPKASDERTREP